MTNKFLIYDPAKKGMILYLKVRAASKINAVQSFVEIQGRQHLAVTIKARPENNKANNEIISFLSSTWNIPKENLEIIRGHKSNFKSLIIKNFSANYLNSVLNNYIK